MSQWRKSSYSSGNGDHRIEVDDADPGRVRDSKDPSGPALAFTPAAWQSFGTGVRSGEFSTSAL